MVDAGGPGSVRKCCGVALADLDDVEGFDRSGKEDQLYAFLLSDGVHKRKKFHTSDSEPVEPSFSSVRSFLKGSDLRQVSSHPIKALSSLTSNPFKGWSGLTLLHDGPLPAA